MAATPSPAEHVYPPDGDDQTTLASYPMSSAQSTRIQYFKGRPNVAELLETEIEATDFSDYCAVGTCASSNFLYSEELVD